MIVPTIICIIYIKYPLVVTETKPPGMLTYRNCIMEGRAETSLMNRDNDITKPNVHMQQGKM